MLSRNIVANGLILLELFSVPQVSADKYDDENGDDSADNKSTGFSEPVCRRLFVGRHHLMPSRRISPSFSPSQ